LQKIYIKIRKYKKKIMNNCHIPVSFGELCDKYSILQIKSERVKDENKLAEINKELLYLKPHMDKLNLNNTDYQKLKNINEKLWNIEDDIRIKEKKNEFDSDFIELARSVYKTNDERAKIKNDINILLKSEIKEIKSYT
jgi:hypothetical protein